MRFALLILMFVSMAACGGDRAEPPASSGDAPLIIATYTVPADTEEEVASVLNALLGFEDRRNGAARVLPNGLVAVSAPASAHGGIRQLIDKLEELPPASGARIRMHYWLVQGRPADQERVPPELASIEQALLDTAAAAGPMVFSKLDYVQHSLRSGSRSGVEGGPLRGHVEAAARGERIALSLDLHASQIDRSVRTELDLESSETVVLAQVGSSDSGEPAMVHLFVIRAERF